MNVLSKRGHTSYQEFSAALDDLGDNTPKPRADGSSHTPTDLKNVMSTGRRKNDNNMPAASASQHYYYNTSNRYFANHY